MIKSNLALLLVERGLKITKVSNDTGISRTTLNSLYHNYAKGIQFDTLDKLCQYLSTSPSKIISYIPIDIKMISCICNKELKNAKGSGSISFTLTNRTRTQRCKLLFDIEYSNSSLDEYCKITTYYDLDFSDHDTENKLEYDFIVSTFQQIPLDFKQVVINQFIEFLREFIPNGEKVEIDFSFDYELEESFKETDYLSSRLGKVIE